VLLKSLVSVMLYSSDLILASLQLEHGVKCCWRRRKIK